MSDQGGGSDSDGGDESFLTESESEHDSTWGEDKSSQKDVDYTATAKEIICENVNITTENALKLNSGYHNMLKILRNKLEILLGQCQERQREIEAQIDEYRNAKRPVARKSRTSGYICGQPFFKDEDLYPGPHNEDYLRRKNVGREFFPLDLFEVTDTNWTVKDKVNILKGVKTQIVEFIERENRLRIRKVGNGLEAERLRREIASLRGKEIGELWEKVLRFPEEYPDQRFEIDWMRISNVNISERHSVSACVGIWNNYMLPGLVRDAWKPEEETRLVEAAERYRRQDWAQIAAEVGGRSAYQCFVHYQTTFSDMAQIKHERWSPAEDALLVRLVDENRVGSNIVWNKVVEKMPLRNKIQCYNRYMFTLMRPTKNEKFSPEEDCVITAYVQEHGEDFKYFPPNLLPGRSHRQIWARYNHTLKYVNKHSGWTIEDDYSLMNFIKENLTDEGPRKISWAACSKVLGNHSRLSCRTRYYTIEKFLEKNPDATLDDVPRKEKRLSTAVTNENWMQTMVEIRNTEANEHGDEEEDAEEAELPSTSSAAPEAPPPEAPAKKTRPKKIIGASKPKLFCETLRCAMKKKLYEKFKYSFHYRFGDQRPDVENKRAFYNQQVICILLNCTTQYKQVSQARQNFTLNELKYLRNSFAIHLNAALINFLQNCTHRFLLPPNYNTILGLRGVVLHANYPETPQKAPAHKKGRPETIAQLDEAGYQAALQAFRARFRTVFLWTMLLARQNPREADFENVDGSVGPHSYTLLESAANEHDYQAQLKEQISLQQLVKLATSRPSEPPPRSCVESLRKVRISRTADTATSSVCVETLNDDEDSLDGIMSPARERSTVEPQNAEVETNEDSLDEPVEPAEQHAPQTTTVEEYCVAEGSANQLSLMSQITVINPGDLPIVELNVPPVGTPVGVVVTEEVPVPTASNDEMVEEDMIVEEDTFSHDLEEEDDGGQFDEQDNVELDNSNQYDQLVSDRQEETIQNEPIELTTTSYDDSPAECNAETTEQRETELSVENLTISSTSVAHITAVTNVGDFVIEELEESEYCEEVVAQTSCDEPLDLHMSPVASTVAAPALEDPAEPNWEPEIVHAPRKTYSRAGRTSLRLSDRQEERVKPTSHAWRWTHLDEQREDDIESHQELWERCDPELDAFRVVQSEFGMDLVSQQRDDEVIVIDDEVEIKEEPLDVEEVNSNDNLIDVQLPPDENQVDESTIQQIIQTASNILRISETYRLDQPILPPPPPPPPPPADPMPTCESFRSVQSGSLVVQTPSRIFDEETNCYYYVDEVQEESGLELPTPEVDINPPVRATPFANQTLEDLLQDSLQATYPVMPQFATPQRVVEPFEAIPITRTPNRTQSTYGRRTRSMVAMEEMYSPSPSINRPKRPPREPEIVNPAIKHNMEVRALTQLDALSKQPRLPPRPTSALSIDQHPSASSHQQKRPHSSQQTRAPKPKRPRTQHLVIEPIDVPIIKQEPLDLLANADEDFSAVDIIDALNSMSQRMKQERLSGDEEEGEEPDDKSLLGHLMQKTPATTAKTTTTTTTESRSVMQKMVRTIIETSAGRSRMDVHFKVAGVTIKKVQQQK
uniref:Putative transcription factor myb superfamily protein n=1 Tax=Culex tarsalis TaxID=7177 RepID=A0A1Q3G106_CULTA